MMLLGISCQKEDLNFENTENQNFEIENRNVDTENRRINYTQIRPVVLGDEYINPYEIGIVNQAIADLYPHGIPVQPTHKYVKFSPIDHQDLVDILDWAHTNGIAMFDHPLTYEIIEEGDYYIDPNVTDEVLSPQYCSVDVSLLMPNAPNEILQELYLDESNPFIFIETYINTGHTDKLDDIIGKGIA
ncbi:MAG: hypothetical protein ACJA1A_000192 [Saprospiraceae bacterium]|jgi:hypothetical protein|tara:strand:+ start:4888 stop:5451 length:564 start_codon:yes stop_codon:yes gene_type:complete